MHQPGISIVAVTRSCSIHIGVGAASGGSDRVAEAIEVDRATAGRAAVGTRPLRALPVEQRPFAVFSDQALAVGVHRRRRRSLLLTKDLRALKVETGSCAARR